MSNDLHWRGLTPLLKRCQTDHDNYVQDEQTLAVSGHGDFVLFHHIRDDQTDTFQKPSSMQWLTTDKAERLVAEWLDESSVPLVKAIAQLLITDGLASTDDRLEELAGHVRQANAKHRPFQSDNAYVIYQLIG